MSAEPWSPEAFEARYRAEGDPWDFAHSPFEQGRYDDILACLPEARYVHAYEPGCAVGALTERLARRCDRVDATDVSPTVVRSARERCRGLEHVHVGVGSVLDDPPADLDLVVFAELGYYLSVDQLDTTADRLAAALVGGGDLLACHWLGESVDHRLHGTVVHARLREVLASTCRPMSTQARPDYVIDVWRRT